MADGRIKVLLVEDSLIDLKVLERMISASPDIEVVGTAREGEEGLALIPQLSPDVICTDLNMPKMDGLEFTRQVMAHHPKPILVISSYVQSEDTQNVFNLLDSGAIDVFPKPRDGLRNTDASHELFEKIRILSGVFVFKRNRSSRKKAESPSPRFRARQNRGPAGVVCIGSSTGGPQALQSLFAQLPDNFPAPILCVQHISKGFLSGLVKWLDSQCPIGLKVVDQGEVAEPGMVYFPQDGHHLEIDSRGTLTAVSGLPVNGHCPSVDVTFKSAATAFGKDAVGVLLTGMGNDGAEGMRAILDSRGFTIAQDEETSLIFGMPKVAIETGAAGMVLPLNQIAQELLKQAKGQKGSEYGTT
jgi:two-component system chemotaxis response regulator CheB